MPDLTECDSTIYTAMMKPLCRIFKPVDKERRFGGMGSPFARDGRRSTRHIEKTGL